MSNRFISKAAPIPNLTGHLLVASPQREDPAFGRSVCLVVHHSQQGAIAVVLNREFRKDARDIWEHIVGVEKEYEAGLLHVGGPESGPVVALHSSEQYAEIETGDGVFFAAQVQNLQALLHAKPRDSKVKILVGQAVWQPGQLEEEFEAGQWAVLPISSNVVFADDQIMWERAMREIGNRFLESIVGNAAPDDILCN